MSRRLGGFSLSLLLFVALASPAAGANPQFNYPDFSSTAGLQLNGSAAQAGNVLQLTPAEFNRIGTAFSTSTIDPQQSFETSFEISMHDGTDDRQPADGMAFVIQSSPRGAGAMSPSIGGSLGYNGIDPSLAVEFDPFSTSKRRTHLPAYFVNAGTTARHRLRSGEHIGTVRARATGSFPSRSPGARCLAGSSTTPPRNT